ncbi:addiction module protein [Geminocystis sp. CENA526]|uniref:addiction module protein n=1 Tax=Geminocystis sp. CENA526 TaxID=1355871 RepID=UPI003D6F2D6C
MASVEQLITEALALPNPSKVLLIKKLAESLEFDMDENVETMWIDEAQKRRQEIKEGIVKPIDGKEALAKIKSRFNG